MEALLQNVSKMQRHALSSPKYPLVWRYHLIYWDQCIIRSNRFMLKTSSRIMTLERMVLRW
ncbi:hypothetical protein Taro_026223 [Colocasia esculenta]|uniref:Uncharacterized protein n=1 Tax=Colocasia esculenta TaxID=4460 RepID=A0A843VBE2_COLES|nr:hypothetical protein [Colocasia esculenta]